MELIEKFLVGTTGTDSTRDNVDNDFEVEFNDFLNKNANVIPRNGEHAFFVWFFLGSLLNLPDSGLMSRMGFKDMEIRCTNNHIGIAFARQVQDEVILNFRSIVLPGHNKKSDTEATFDKSELKELALKWHFDFYQLHNVDMDVRRLEISMFKDKRKVGKTKFEATYETIDATEMDDSLVMIAKEITSQEMLNKRIKLSEEDKKFFGLTESLESKIKIFSEALNALSSGYVEQLKSAVLTQLNEFYNTLKTHGDMAKIPLEGESPLAFLAGGYMMNYQKRYQLHCEIHTMPVQDTLLLSILSGAQIGDLYKGNIPVIFTSSLEDPATRNSLLRKEGIREMLPSFTTDSSIALLIVTDHELELSKQPFGMSSVSINQGLFYKFLSALNYLPRDKKFYESFLNKELKNFASKLGSKTPTMISCFTLGQLLSLQGSWTEKNFFIYDDQIMQQEVKTFLVSKEDNLIAIHIVGEQLDTARMENFFKNNLVNIYDKRRKNVININLILDSSSDWKIDVNVLSGNERLLELAPVFHEGRIVPISTIEPTNLFSRMVVRDLTKATRSLTTALRDHRRLINNEFHMKALLKGLFSSGLMILSNLESRNRQMLGLISQTHLRQIPSDLSLKEMLEMPPLTGNAMLDNNPLLLKLSSTYQLMDDEQERLKIIDKHIVSLWSDYYEYMNFPNNYAKPVLGALIFNGNPGEDEHLVTGVSWKLTDEMTKVLRSIKAASCGARLRKRDSGCFDYENLKSMLEAKDGLVKIESQKFLELAQGDPQKAGFILNTLSRYVGETFEVTGDRAQLLDTAMQQSRLTTKLQRLGSYANLGTIALIAKDIVSSLAQERYGAAAATSAFLTANIALGMAPSAITKLADGLGLRGYKYTSWALKTVAPFTGKLASAYVLYDLVKNIKAKNNIDSGMTMANIIADGAFLFIDVLDLGIAIGERFALIEGASTVFGPVGSLVEALVFVGVNVYSAYKSVQNLDEVIKLTAGEEIVLGLRSFVGMEPQGYLIELAERKEHHERIAECALEFLNNGSKFDSYFMPMHFRSGQIWEDAPNNCVDFGTKVAMSKLPRDTPDDPKNGKLLCFDPDGSGKAANGLLNGFNYYCDNVIGVTRNENNPFKSVLFDLRDGADCVQAAALNGSNLYIIGDGTKSIRNSAGFDYYLFVGDKTYGSIYGRFGKGEHLLDLSIYAKNASKVVVDLSLARPAMRTYGDYFFLYGITKVIGRTNGQDSIYPSCKTTYVDSGHGKCSRNRDFVKILNRMCTYNMTIKVQNNVDIVNKALFGIFTYNIQTTISQSFVYITRRSKAIHRLIFNSTINDLIAIKVVSTSKGKQFVFNFKKYSLLVRCYQTNCNYHFRDGIFMKIDRNGVNVHYHAYLDTDLDPESVMSLYAPIADRLSISFTVHSTYHDSTVFISHKRVLKFSKLSSLLHGSNVMQNNPESMTYMYGAHETENLFIIRSGRERLYSFQDASIEPVFIYEDFQAANYTRTLVLTELADQVKKDLDADLLVKIVPDYPTDNLLLEVLAVDEDHNQHSLTHIRFNGSLVSELYQKLQIIIKDIPYHVVRDGEIFLRPAPVVDMNNETAFLLLNEENLPYNFTEFHIPKNVMANFSLFKTENKSLILLEEQDFQVQNSPQDPFFIVMMGYFDKNENSTLKTTIFSFEQSRIDLKELKPDYHELASFENFVRDHQSLLNDHLERLLMEKE